MKIPQSDAVEDMTSNLTPLIDVVFLLLIFFMLATTFLDPEKEISIELPEAANALAQEQEPHEVIINVLRDGRVVVGGVPLDEDGLVRALRTTATRDPETQVTIRGDRLVHHERIVRVMDACGMVGLVNLAVGTMEEG